MVIKGRTGMLLNLRMQKGRIPKECRYGSSSMYFYISCITQESTGASHYLAKCTETAGEGSSRKDQEKSRR